MKRITIPALLSFFLVFVLFLPVSENLNSRAQMQDIHLEFHPPPDKSPHFVAFVRFSYYFATQFLTLAASGEILEKHEVVIRFTEILSKDSPEGFSVILISIDPENFPYSVLKAIKMEEINSEEKVKKKTEEIAKLVLKHIKEIEALPKEKKEKERSPGALLLYF